MTDYEHFTSVSFVNIYNSSHGVFLAILNEVKELSKKKPEATLSKSKVSLINTVLTDLLIFLKQEPEGKYLRILEDEDLPQVSDALMMMVQFQAASNAFYGRYYQFVKKGYGRGGTHQWITSELLEAWRVEDEEEDDDGEGYD